MSKPRFWKMRRSAIDHTATRTMNWISESALRIAERPLPLTGASRQASTAPAMQSAQMASWINSATMKTDETSR